MANLLNRADLLTTFDYDIVFTRDTEEGQLDLARTTADPIQNLAQMVYNLISTTAGSYVLDSKYGASPLAFKGQALTPLLLREIKVYIRNLIATSRVLVDYSYSVKVAPIARDKVAIRLEVLTPSLDRDSGILKVNMLWSSATASIEHVSYIT